MYQTINKSDFRDAFQKMGRAGQFSYEGLGALYDWLEEMGVVDEMRDETNDVELDVIALCCEFTEYKNLKELQENYTDIASMEDLVNNTSVIMVDDDSFIYNSGLLIR